MNWVKPLLFLSTVILLATAIILFVFFQNVWLLRKWNIPIDPPGFHDSRQLAWAAEAYAQGYDPLMKNPVNPRGHQLNYPRIWHLLFALGINESHTNILGSIVVILFFIGIGIFWFHGKFDNLTYFILSIIILSPAVMLGIERSNIELVLFFILSLALAIDYYSNISALFLFIFASVLKLYPVFAFVYLLKENRKKFWTLFLSALGLFMIYAVFSFNDFMQVYKTTPKLVGSSFGINVWWMGLRNSRFFGLPISDSLALFLKVISYLLAFLILFSSLLFSMRLKNGEQYKQGQHLNAFRVGASIYIGCFILMNTHDYRLIFLIFTVPQLATWLVNKGKVISLAPLVTLMAILLSLWSFFIMHFIGRKTTFIIEEFSNWIIFAGLLYLFFSSLPDWFKDYIRQPFFLKRRK
ncbi:MAG: hypothetical protein HZC48_10035 [Nitrospirae bacterium]|nr:hypothetical protein [Nitrospirota bacterium]